MNFANIFVILISHHLLPQILAGSSAVFQRSQLPLAKNHAETITRRISSAWIQKNCGGNFSPRNFVKRESDPMSDSGDDMSSDEGGSSSSSSDDSMMTTLKGLIKKIPQINFYSSIPNAVGVVGQGFSVLEKVSIALGTPLPYFIGTLPIMLFGIALVFIPDLTTLNLPGFYPAGAGEGDPLSAFPPLPDLDGLPDVDLSLNADNIPPRIIPPKDTPQQMPETLLDEGSSILSPPTSVQENEEADSPTNPLSFQAPRRRVGEGEGGHVHVQQMMPHNYNNYNYYKPPVIISRKSV